jgi:hypothetical protein
MGTIVLIWKFLIFPLILAGLIVLAFTLLLILALTTPIGH